MRNLVLCATDTEPSPPDITAQLPLAGEVEVTEHFALTDDDLSK
jgi:hypothetical protein